MHNWRNEVDGWKYSTWAGCFMFSLPAGVDLVGVDLKNENLQGVNLAGRKIENCNFDSANLAGVNLQKTVLKNCSFRGATLKGANLQVARIFNCDFREATIVNCDLSWVVMKETSFWAASIDGRFYDEYKDDNACNFYASEISNSCFEGARIKNIDFRFTSFRGGSFIGATLKEVLFNSETLEQFHSEKKF